MFGFLFRKTIFDGWDNILRIFLANILYIILLALEVLWWYLNAKGILALALTILLMLLTLVIISIYTMGVAVFTANICEGARKQETLKGIKETIKTHIPHCIMHSFIIAVVFVNVVFAIPFYLQMEGFMGPVMAFVGLFLSVFLVFNFKYYLPLCIIRSKESVLDIVKYSFAYALDNKGVTAGLMLRSALDLIISVPLVGILPGFTGILLSDNCATIILNKRYLMAEEKKVEKSEIPMNDVLFEMGKQKYDKRKMTSLLFPGR